MKLLTVGFGSQNLAQNLFSHRIINISYRRTSTARLEFGGDRKNG